MALSPIISICAWAEPQSVKRKDITTRGFMERIDEQFLPFKAYAKLGKAKQVADGLGNVPQAMGQLIRLRVSKPQAEERI